MTITAEAFKKVIHAWADTMLQNREELIRLDGVAGDSDLGLTMTDGFRAAAEAADAYTGTDMGMLVYTAGKAVLSKAPSSLGTLLGSGLLEAGKACKGKTALETADFAPFFAAVEEGVAKRGKAQPGEKTFLDGLHPAVAVLSAYGDYPDDNALLDAAAKAARAGADDTANMVARHGRMAIRGDLSLGMIDPGAVVAALLVESFAQALKQD